MRERGREEERESMYASECVNQFLCVIVRTYMCKHVCVLVFVG